MNYTTEIYLDKKAIVNNIEFLKSYIGNNIRISSVVKANAYGHGIEQFVPMVESLGVNHFSVFSYHEALSVYKVTKRSTDIMIMGWFDDSFIKDILKKGIEVFVFNPERLEALLNISIKLNIPAKIHLEIETGMNRTGLNKRELSKVVKIIKENPNNFIIKGICSHLAGPESIANHVRVKQQISNFKSIIKDLEKKGFTSEYRHIACSAATMSYPESRLNMVRIGIMQYGFWSSKEVYLKFIHNKNDIVNPLKRVISWKSEVMSIKKVKTGEFISYGTTFLAQHEMKIAVVPLGYSNGYSRSLSNHGRVIVVV